MLDDCTAAILAGGAATRMGGVSKALLELGGRTILERQLAVLRPLFARVLLVSNDPGPFERFGVEVVADVITKRGAPGGVHAALSSASTPWTFCLACDMPFIRASAIELLAGKRAGVDAVAPRRGGHPEPMFAFWSSAFRALFEAELSRGSTSLARLLGLARARMVDEAELEAADPGCASLENVNTPSDLRRALARLG